MEVAVVGEFVLRRRLGRAGTEMKHKPTSTVQGHGQGGDTLPKDTIMSAAILSLGSDVSDVATMDMV